MAKTGEIRYDGNYWLLTMATNNWEEAIDLATVMGKAGLTDVETSQTPIQASLGDNSGSEMIRLLTEEGVNYFLNNP